jgi:hypothetical protein
MSTEPKWLTEERARIIAEHPELAGIRNYPIGTLRGAAQSIEASKAQAAPLPRPSKASKHEPTTAELVAEATRLTAEVARLSAARTPATAPKSEVMHTGESRDQYLDRVMGTGAFAPGTRGSVVNIGPVQRFGVRGK